MTRERDRYKEEAETARTKNRDNLAQTQEGIKAFKDQVIRHTCFYNRFLVWGRWLNPNPLKALLKAFEGVFKFLWKVFKMFLKSF